MYLVISPYQIVIKLVFLGLVEKTFVMRRQTILLLYLVAFQTII